jgi:hypothetical protein
MVNGLPFVTATKVICGPFENCKMLMVSRMQFLPNVTEIKAINFWKLAQRQKITIRGFEFVLMSAIVLLIQSNHFSMI